jgi:hypothetical protein
MDLAIPYAHKVMARINIGKCCCFPYNVDQNWIEKLRWQRGPRLDLLNLRPEKPLANPQFACVTFPCYMFDVYK